MKIVISFFLYTGMIYSQASISGRILDEAKQPLSFSNIILYDCETNKFVSGIWSDDHGNYTFSNVVKGSYQLEIFVFGFKTHKSACFDLSDENQQTRLDFVLIEDLKMLDEVVIKSRRPVIEQTAEKLIVNLEQSEMVHSNLQDVMKKIPGIIVTNGRITYGGQQGIRILINGKSTDYMDVSSLLRDFPADNIAKVELIQQPGAEFDASGSGPLINIILKKNVKLGTNGNIKLSTGYDNRPEYGIGGAMSNYKNKLNWQIDAGYRKSTWREDLFITRRINDEIYDQTTISPYKPITYRFNGGIDYYVNEQQTVGLGTSLLNSDSERLVSNSTQIFKRDSSEKLFSENSFERKSKTYTVNPYYKFENEKNHLSLDFDFVDYHNDNINNLYKVGESTIVYDAQRYFQDAKYQILTYKADYKRTVNQDFNWMVGAKYSSVSSDSELRSLYQNSDGDFIFDSDQNNAFFVNENILAVYSKVMRKWDSWTFSGGIRWENSSTQGTSTSLNISKSRKISKLFPSASVDKKITERLGVNLSYSNRILRPSYSSLNAFVYYYDPYTFEQGNPNLKPEFTNSFQFNLTYDNKPFFSVAYKNTTDALFEIVAQNDSTAQTSRSVINLEKRENWNFRGFAPINFISNLEGYTGLIVNYNKFESESLSPKLDLNKWSLTWYTNLEYQFPWEIKSELTGYYTTGGLQGQIKHDWLAGLSFALSKKLAKERFKINFGINEVLNRKFKGSINYDNINANILSDWSRQNVYFQFTYNFGSSLSKKRINTNPSEDELGRIKENN